VAPGLPLALERPPLKLPDSLTGNSFSGASEEKMRAFALW
jgi:hypothetical protein